MSSPLGTDKRPLRVAIIGSGPSGFYAADMLAASPIHVTIDIFEKLPTPYGLVRYGVAPDHPNIKNVTKIYEKIAQRPQIKFFGNVNVAVDISMGELKKFYDAILIACGAETDKKLGIPGENIPGSYTATEFVAWYNGHPDYAHAQFDLSHQTAVVIGQGNVALDVCRILCKTPDELKSTDIAQHALDVLAESKIKNVYCIGRRGPIQAAFTPQEFKEMGKLTDCDVIISPTSLNLMDNCKVELNNPENLTRRKNFELIQQYFAVGDRGKSKKFYLRFLRSPIELKGDKKLEKVILGKNQMVGEPGCQLSRTTNETEELSCGILFRSVGYRGVPLPGVPFSDKTGVIPNLSGRVLDLDKVVPGMYATGWIKRGPSGIIGTNKPDSEETVKNILEDVKDLVPCETSDTNILLKMLDKKGIRVVSFEDWRKIDAAEIQRGQTAGKPREKFVNVKAMLEILS